MFSKSSFYVSDTIEQILQLGHQSIARKLLLKRLPLLQSKSIVNQQLTLLTQGNPQKDKGESRFQVLNVWRVDNEPTSILCDTLNPYSVPSNFADETQLEEPVLRNSFQISIDQETKKKSSDKHRRPRTAQLELQKVLLRKSQHPQDTGGLMKLLQDDEAEPIQIELLRKMKWPEPTKQQKQASKHEAQKSKSITVNTIIKQPTTQQEQTVYIQKESVATSTTVNTTRILKPSLLKEDRNIVNTVKQGLKPQSAKPSVSNPRSVLPKLSSAKQRTPKIILN